MNLTQLESDINHALETKDYFEMHDTLMGSLELIRQYQQLKAREKSVSQLLKGIVEEVDRFNLEDKYE